MTDRNCMTFDEEELIKEWRKNSEGKMEWTGRYLRISPYVHSGLHSGDDPLVFLMEDPSNEVLPLTGSDIMSVVDIQNASVSHEDGLRGSEIEKTGGSEGGNVSEAPGGSSGLGVLGR